VDFATPNTRSAIERSRAPPDAQVLVKIASSGPALWAGLIIRSVSSTKCTMVIITLSRGNPHSHTSINGLNS